MKLINREAVLRRLREARCGADVLQIQADLHREAAACTRMLTLAAAGRHVAAFEEVRAAELLAALPDVEAAALPALAVRWLSIPAVTGAFREAAPHLGGAVEAAYLHPLQLAELRGADPDPRYYNFEVEDLLGRGGTMFGAQVVASPLVPEGDFFLSRGSGAGLRAVRVAVGS